MSPTLTTFLFEIVNFLLLVWLVSWLLFKPVRAALQARQEAERRRREEVAAGAADIDQQRRELDERLRAFEGDTARMRQEQLNAVTQEASSIRAQAREAAQRERESVKQAMAQLERAQIEQLSAAVAAAARETVVRLLATLDTRDLETSLVRAATRRLAVLDKAQLGAVLVESAHPLDEANRAILTEALDGDAQGLDFRVVPDLGDGIRIVTARGVIDASTRGIAREAERRLTEVLALPVSEAIA